MSTPASTTPLGTTPNEAATMRKPSAASRATRLRKSATQTFYLLATIAVLLVGWEVACHVF